MNLTRIFTLDYGTITLYNIDIRNISEIKPFSNRMGKIFFSFSVRQATSWFFTEGFFCSRRTERGPMKRKGNVIYALPNPELARTMRMHKHRVEKDRKKDAAKRLCRVKDRV